MRTNPIAKLGALLLLAAAAACGQARNTPEEAFDTLKTAVSQERWDLLYEILSPKVQQEFAAQMAAIDVQIAQITAAGGAAAAAEVVRRDLGVTPAEWQAMGPTQRFAVVFDSPKVPAQMQLAELKLNADLLRDATIKDVQVRGEKAEILIDDGKGHRRRLQFVLRESVWRYEPGASES